MREKLDICFLSSLHPPKDKRVFEKEAVSLAKAGFRVAHLAPGKPGTASESGVDIYTYPRPNSIAERLLQLPRLLWMAREIDTACYHCNEVDSWFVGVMLKLLTGRKVVFDVHELYPAELAESRFPPPLRPAVEAAVRVAIRAMMPFTDKIVLAKESVAPDYPGSEAKQILVENFTSLAASGNQGRRTRNRPSGGRIRAVHIGGMSKPRGWPQLLEAFKEPGLEQVDLVLVGDFPTGDQAEFEAEAQRAGVLQRITIRPWLPFREVFELLLECDIGLVLFQPGYLNHVHASPHKMFDYMLAELPVVAPGFAIEVARIVKEAGCGILLDPSDPRAIASAIRSLAADPQGRQAFGSRGRRAVLERYNWEREAEKLIESYVALLGPGTRQPSATTATKTEPGRTC